MLLCLSSQFSKLLHLSLLHLVLLLHAFFLEPQHSDSVLKQFQFLGCLLCGRDLSLHVNAFLQHVLLVVDFQSALSRLFDVVVLAIVVVLSAEAHVVQV